MSSRLDLAKLSKPLAGELAHFAGQRVLAVDGEIIKHPFGDALPNWALSELAKAHPGNGWYEIPAQSSPAATVPDVNPWMPQSLNLTRQVEITRNNPDVAAKLKAAAKGAAK